MIRIFRVSAATDDPTVLLEHAGDHLDERPDDLELVDVEGPVDENTYEIVVRINR